MDIDKIGLFIKENRKRINLTQKELALKLNVTEKAISRWETGRGTPDISLLIPLSEELGLEVSDILLGSKKEEKIVTKSIIEYVELNRKGRFNWPLKLALTTYLISILTFLFYLKLEYNPLTNINYFYLLILVMISSLFILIGNFILSNNYIDKIEDKKKIVKLTHIIIFIYYIILMFNMVIFARFNSSSGYNLVLFKSIIEILNGNQSIYFKFINLVGNFMIYMPFAYFIKNIFYKIDKHYKYLLVIFLIVLSIEVMQLIFNCGVFDIDDILLNVLGSYLFYILLCIINKKN